MEGARYREICSHFGKISKESRTQQEVYLSELRDQDTSLADDVLAMLDHDAAANDVDFLVSLDETVETHILMEGHGETVHREEVSNDTFQYPQKVNDYEIIEMIGQGGMGIVLKAMQPNADRLVALKMISSTVLPQVIERFHIEAKSAARLEHPHIVPVYDVGEYNGLPFFTMAYIDGQNLKETIHSQTMGNHAAAALLRTLAAAVSFAHERGILHRDLKPANVLIDSEGKPWLTDFGLAKRMDIDDSNTMTGQILGTASYISPEQLSDQFSVGAPTDVYGLGGILYECLTGKAPFQDADILKVFEKVRTQAPVPPRELNSEIDPSLEAICLRCLEKDPGNRYLSAEALASDLERYLNGEPPLVAPPSIASAVHRVLRHRTTSDELSSARATRWHAISSSLIHLAIFALIATNQHAGWLWLTITCGVLMCSKVSWRFHFSRYWTLHPVERQSVIIMLAVNLSFLTLLWIYGPGWTAPIELAWKTYPPLAIVYGVSIICHGAIYSGKLLLLGLIYFPLAGLLAANPYWSPLVFGAATAIVLWIAECDMIENKK